MQMDQQTAFSLIKSLTSIDLPWKLLLRPFIIDSQKSLVNQLTSILNVKLVPGQILSLQIYESLHHFELPQKYSTEPMILDYDDA